MNLKLREMLFRERMLVALLTSFLLTPVDSDAAENTEIPPEENLGFGDSDDSIDGLNGETGNSSNFGNAQGVRGNNANRNIEKVGSNPSEKSPQAQGLNQSPPNDTKSQSDTTQFPDILQPATEDPAMDADPSVVPDSTAASSESALGTDTSMSGTPAAGGSVVAQDTEIIAAKVLEPNEFAGAPPIPGSLRNVADGEAPEEYVVEPGDTLFDVCSQLLDEGGYWPKLWSVNPQIKNPHFIWPGMRLVFYSGTIDTPPFLQVVAEEDLIPIDKGQLVEEQLMHGKVPEMDKSFEVTSAEVIDSNQLEIPQEIDSQISVVGNLFDPTSRRIMIPGFIFSSEQEPKGIVIGGVEGEAMIGESRQALVEFDEPLSPGSTYSVLRFEAGIESPKSGDDIGYFYSFVANVKVLSNIPDSDFSIVEVVQSRLGIERGDIVIPFVSTSRTVPITSEVGTISASDGNVVAFEDQGRFVGGEGGLLFIDKGTNAGVSVGQFYRVYSRPGFLATNDIKDDLEDVNLPTAVIKIVDTTDVGSLGFIVKTSREVHLGDSLAPIGVQ